MEILFNLYIIIHVINTGEWMNIVFLLICYLAGSIPFGLLVGFTQGIDVRKHGSFNIGFTNVKRVCGTKVAIPVLILDFLKGFLPILLLAPVLTEGRYSEIYHSCGGIACVLGHNFPVWIKFKGGKGVATGGGVFCALAPIPMLIGTICWIILVKCFKYVSLGSIIGSYCAALSQLFIHWYIGDLSQLDVLMPTIIIALISIVVTIRHRSNISRLLCGKENKF